MTSVTGSCLCEAIRFQLTSEPGYLVYCHCAMCRKASGAAFAAVFQIDEASLQFVSGGEDLKYFQSSPHKRRYFCGQCGSPIYSQVEGRPYLRMRAGLFDALPDIEKHGHIFTGSKAAWHDIEDDLPQHTAREPGRA